MDSAIKLRFLHNVIVDRLKKNHLTYTMTPLNGRVEFLVESPLHVVVTLGRNEDEDTGMDEIYVKYTVKNHPETQALKYSSISYNPEVQQVADGLDWFLYQTREILEKEIQLDQTIREKIEDVIGYCLHLGIHPNRYVDYVVSRMSNPTAPVNPKP
jgi:hypothetical protein